jgi:uncharacterized membrane protein YccF (DUF307 family)
MVMLVPEETPKRTWRYRLDAVIVWGNRQPVLLIRRVVWIVTAGWWMFFAYVLFSVSMIMTIILIPFVPQALKLSCFAFDPVTLEAVRDPKRFKKPFTIVANVVWAVLFGWTLCLGFAAAALVQALTVVGFPTALTFVGFAKFVLMPFGSDIRKQFLPTTVAELHAHRAGLAAVDAEGAPQQQGGGGKVGPLADRGAPMGENAV